MLGLPEAAAADFAIKTLGGSRVLLSNKDIYRLVGLLANGGYVWPVALNAVLEELAIQGTTTSLVSAQNITQHDITELLARSLKRRIDGAPNGLSHECYWTMRIIGRAVQTNTKATRHLLAGASAARTPDELEKVLHYLAEVRLLVTDAGGGWQFAHEAIAGALHQIRAAEERGGDADVLEVIERWRANGRITSEDGETLLLALRTALALPLSVLVLTAACLAKGLVGDLSGTLALLQNRLREARNEDILTTVRSLQSSAPSPDAAFLDAALLYSGTSAGVESFLRSASRSLMRDDGGLLAADIERLLMSVDGAGIVEAVEAHAASGESPQVTISVMRVLLRRDDLVVSAPTASVLVNIVQFLDPGLALEFIARFDAPSLAAHCKRLLKSTATTDRVAAIGKLFDADRDTVATCAADLYVLRETQEPLERRRVLGLVAARPEVFPGELYPAFIAEQSALVREGILETIRPDHLEAPKIVAAASRDKFDFVRESAIYAAGRCNLDQSAFEALVACALKDDSEKVREAAVRMAQRHGLAIPKEELLSGLRSHQEALLGAFMSALAVDTADDIDLALADIVMDEGLRRDLRVTALLKLGERGGDVAVWTISSMLANPDVEVVANAIVSAQMTADGRHMQVLSKLARHPLAGIRERVVYAAAEIGGEGAVRLCVELLLDPVAEIRERSVYALLRLGALAQLPVIERALQAETSPAVLSALGELRRGFGVAS